MITAAQLRAARGLLDWGRAELSQASKVSQETIKNIEHGVFHPQEATEEAILRAFAVHGVEFTENDGVRCVRDSVIRLEGTPGFKVFLDDVFDAAQQPYSAIGGDLPLYATAIRDEDFPRLLGDYFFDHVRRMNTIKNFKMHLLVKERPTTKVIEETRNTYREYRYRPKGDSANASFYVYGNKLAILNFEQSENSPQILVISSALAAKAYREQFEALWDFSTPVE